LHLRCKDFREWSRRLSSVHLIILWLYHLGGDSRTKDNYQWEERKYYQRREVLFLTYVCVYAYYLRVCILLAHMHYNELYSARDDTRGRWPNNFNNINKYYTYARANRYYIVREQAVSVISRLVRELILPHRYSPSVEETQICTTCVFFYHIFI